MAEIRPFPGLRPIPEKAGEIASPPYDVLSSAEARQQVKGNPLSFLHVVKPEVDLPEDVDLYDDRVYAQARENFEKLRREGMLIQDSAPSYYFYRQVMDGRGQLGLVAGAAVSDYENDTIKKHEKTRADKEADRCRHVDVLSANAGPVFLTYRSRPEMDRLAGEATAGEPLYDFTADDGVRHTFWRVEDPRVAARITDVFAGIDLLYVADGHHRSASAAIVGRRRREANPAHTGREEYNYFLSVIFPHDQLNILPYNRVVRDLHGLTPESFLRKIAPAFDVSLSPDNLPVQPDRRHAFGMYLDGKWYRLEAREGSYPPEDPVGSLDVSILQENLLAPILGIGDPRTDQRIDFVGGIRGLKELSRRVDGGEAVAFALFPTSVEELMAIADQGRIMPPKSTWFEPKLRSGLIVHLLD